MRTAIKKVLKALDSGNAQEAQDAYKQAVPIIHASAGKGLIHQNKAARHKSRLNKRLKALG